MRKGQNRLLKIMIDKMRGASSLKRRFFASFVSFFNKVYVIFIGKSLMFLKMLIAFFGNLLSFFDNIGCSCWKSAGIFNRIESFFRKIAACDTICGVFCRVFDHFLSPLLSELVCFKKKFKGGVLIEFAFCVPVLIVVLFFINDHYRFYELRNKVKNSAYMMANMLQNIKNTNNNKAISINDIKNIAYASCLNFFNDKTVFRPWPLGMCYTGKITYVKRISENKYYTHSYIFSTDRDITPQIAMFNIPILKILKQVLMPDSLYAAVWVDGENSYTGSLSPEEREASLKQQIDSLVRKLVNDVKAFGANEGSPAGVSIVMHEDGTTTINDPQAEERARLEQIIADDEAQLQTLQAQLGAIIGETTAEKYVLELQKDYLQQNIPRTQYGNMMIALSWEDWQIKRFLENRLTIVNQQLVIVEEQTSFPAKISCTVSAGRFITSAQLSNLNPNLVLSVDGEENLIISVAYEPTETGADNEGANQIAKIAGGQTSLSTNSSNNMRFFNKNKIGFFLLPAQYGNFKNETIITPKPGLFNLLIEKIPVNKWTYIQNNKALQYRNDGLYYNRYGVVIERSESDDGYIFKEDELHWIILPDNCGKMKEDGYLPLILYN